MAPMAPVGLASTWFQVAVHNAQLIVAVLDAREDLLYNPRCSLLCHAIWIINDTIEELTTSAELLLL